MCCATSPHNTSHWYLTGRFPHLEAAHPYLSSAGHAVLAERADRFRFVAADVETFLRDCEPGSFSAFNYSNIFEYLDADTHRRILELTVRAARPGARICYWNLLVPRWRPDELADRIDRDEAFAARLHAGDRSFVYQPCTWRLFDDHRPTHRARRTGGRWVLLLAVLLLTGIAGMGASRVGVDNAVDIWFVDDDPALVAYRDFLETFGNDEVVVTAVFDETSRMYTEQGLQQIHAVAEAARATDGIGTARSMVDVTGVRSGPGTLDIGPAIEDWPIDAQMPPRPRRPSRPTRCCRASPTPPAILGSCSPRWPRWATSTNAATPSSPTIPPACTRPVPTWPMPASG